MATAKKSKAKATPEGTTDRNHLIGVIQTHTGASKATSKQVLDEILETVSLSLKKNKRVQLLGFGNFVATHRPAKMGRNPQTGAPVEIKAANVPKFKPGKGLKDKLN